MSKPAEPARHTQRAPATSLAHVVVPIGAARPPITLAERTRSEAAELHALVDRTTLPLVVRSCLTRTCTASAENEARCAIAMAARAMA